jgi:hypothetical protein
MIGNDDLMINTDAECEVHVVSCVLLRIANMALAAAECTAVTQWAKLCMVLCCCYV